jgi:transcriptional regulator with XRE-family HTH domain
MSKLSLTRGESGADNYFAMSEGKEKVEAFLAMFAEMRRTLREAGWTQRRLCAALGRSESWISKILHAGRGMDITDLLKICEVTGIPPEKLLAGYPCPRRGLSEEDQIAKRLHELLPEDIRQRLIELEKK